MPKGKGIPGLAWETGMPVLVEDIGKANEFIRAADAQLAGITTGISIPIGNEGTQTYVMTFLSAKDTPIAKRIQIWVPEGNQLVCRQGHSKNSNDLAEMFETLQKKYRTITHVSLKKMLRELKSKYLLYFNGNYDKIISVIDTDFIL